MSRLLAQLPPCSKPVSNSHNCCTAQLQNLAQSGTLSLRITVVEPGSDSQYAAGWTVWGFLPPFLPPKASRFLLTFHQPSPPLLHAHMYFGGGPLSFSGGWRYCYCGLTHASWDLKFVLPSVGWTGCRASRLYPSASHTLLFHFDPHTTWKHLFPKFQGTEGIAEGWNPVPTGGSVL